MSGQKLLILNQKQIEQKIERMAYQILEDNLDEKEIVLAGIVNGGYTLAKRLEKALQRISSFKIRLMKIELDKDCSHLEAQVDFPVEEAANQVVILVDDVLNSGRTLVYGLGVFLNIPLKKLRTLVLVDRSHRKFPVSADFCGLELSTVLKQHVKVVLDEGKDEDGVYLS